MLVSIIAAIDRRGLIGDEGGLPWHLPNDLRRFRALTWGKPILMGRTTFELIGKPLPGRVNIVLSRSPQYSPPGCRIVRTLQDALALAEDCLAASGGTEVMIIGGGKVYAETIHLWDRLYLTVVEGEFQGSTYFPIRALLRQNWRPVCEPETHAADEKNRYAHSFHILERAQDATHHPLQTDEGNLSRTCAGPGPAPEGLDLAAVLARGTLGGCSRQRQ